MSEFFQGSTGAVLPGFADPVDDAQRVFRRLLDAFARPGTIVTIDAPAELPPGPFGRGAIGAALALIDFETPVWFDAAAVPALPHLRFHCNCPIAATPDQAAYALIGAPPALPSLDDFALGIDAYPDRSTTLVIEVEVLTETGDLVLTGPGIRDAVQLEIGGLPRGFWGRRAALAPLFPRGLDLIFTCGDRLAAVPRTTQVEV
jgi:alpha-D-ribose 1-methylphosphonate 5-triphosphate synthase subunit PhnH